MDTKIVRPNWDEYFMSIAKAVSTRSSCLRAQVGAVIVSSDKRILATGYNGAPSGEKDCLEIGCLMENNHCIRAVHAEMNAICYAAKYGVIVDKANIYVYDTQFRELLCVNCAKALKSAGILKCILVSKIDEIRKVPIANVEMITFYE